MRKLFVMLVVMAVVFGMSAGVMADYYDSSTTNINLEVQTLTDVKAPDSLSLIISDLTADSGVGSNVEDVSERRPLTIETNNAVNVSITQNWENLKDELNDLPEFTGLTEDQLLWDGNYNNPYLIAASMVLNYTNKPTIVEVRNDDNGNNRFTSPTELSFNLDDNGFYEFEISEEININTEYTGTGNTGSYRWSDIPADTYENAGVITVTISSIN